MCPNLPLNTLSSSFLAGPPLKAHCPLQPVKRWLPRRPLPSCRRVRARARGVLADSRAPHRLRSGSFLGPTTRCVFTLQPRVVLGTARRLTHVVSPGLPRL